MDALSKRGVCVQMLLRRHLRALEQVARLLADANAHGCPPKAARGYLFVIDVRDGTAARFLSGWKLWANIGSYEAKYYPCLVRACPASPVCNAAPLGARGGTSC